MKPLTRSASLLGTHRRRLVAGGMVVALLVFWLVQLRHLAVVPRAYEDEAWIASTSYKLATTGVFGTDIQGDYFGMSHHYYGFMPFYPMLQSLVLRAAGLGLWQSRLASVYLGLLTLALTYALGRKLFSAPVGLLAVGGLLLTVTAGLTVYRPTGIWMIDFGRMARYDIAVPVFGVAGLLALGRTPLTGGWRAWAWPALAGVLAGLAGLSHVYGWFWLPALGLAILYHGGRRRAWRWTLQAGAALTLGAALIIGPYLMYVLTDYASFVGQMGEYSDRMELTNLRWYAANLLTEVRRYGPGLDESGWLRPGLWLTVLATPVAALVMVRRAPRSLLAAAALSALVLLPALLGLLITSKVSNYLLLFLPVAAVAVAGALGQVWAWATARQWRWLRAGLLVVGVAAAAEGVSQWQRIDLLAVTTTPFDTYIGRVRAAVDAVQPQPVVVGLHTYWYGFSDLRFTTWYYPFARARTPVDEGVQPVSATLEHLAPDVVLLDARMQGVWDAPESDRPATEVRLWLAANYTLRASIEDETYGRMDVYGRTDAAP